MSVYNYRRLDLGAKVIQVNTRNSSLNSTFLIHFSLSSGAFVLIVFMMHSHCTEAGHHGPIAVKEEPAEQGHEVVHEGGDGEYQRELLILAAAV